MKNFKGFDEWIEVFRTGTHTDSAGNTRDWKEDDLKKIAENYDPGKNEAPIVIGHPTDNSPAYGWVEKIKEESGILWAKCKDVIPEFTDMVKKGLFKKRSISLYPDLTLRHIGFLGATPPAVKGLADLKFSEDEGAILFEFVEKHKTAASEKEEKIMTFKDFMEMFKFWKEAESNPDMQLPDTKGKGTGDGDRTFSEADVETIKKEAVAAERKKTEVEFAEKEREGREKAARKETSDWVGQRVKEGKILPSWAASGLVEFMQGLDAGTEIEFAEGTEKKTPLKFFQDLLEGLEKSPIFKEIATKEKAGDSGDFAEAEKDQKLGEAIAAKAN